MLQIVTFLIIVSLPAVCSELKVNPQTQFRDPQFRESLSAVDIHSTRGTPLALSAMGSDANVQLRANICEIPSAAAIRIFTILTKDKYYLCLLGTFLEPLFLCIVLQL